MKIENHPISFFYKIDTSESTDAIYFKAVALANTRKGDNEYLEPVYATCSKEEYDSFKGDDIFRGEIVSVLRLKS